MTAHHMHLQTKYFDFIKYGTKRIELRLNDPKRQQIQLGDQIEFSEPGGDQLTVKVIGLLHYQNFAELLSDFDVAILSDKNRTKADLLAALTDFYSIAKQAKYGVLGIRIEPLNQA